MCARSSRLPTPAGVFTAVTQLAQMSSLLAQSSSPIPLTPARVACAARWWSAIDSWRPSSRSSSQAPSRPRISTTEGGEGGETRRRGSGAGGGGGGAGEALLRAGDADVETPVVGPELLAAERGDDVRD